MTRLFQPVDSQARQTAAQAVSTASTAASSASSASSTASALVDRVAKLERVRRTRVSLPAIGPLSTAEVAVSWASAVLPAGTVVVNVTLEVPSTGNATVSVSVKAGSVSASGCTLLVRNSGAGALTAMAAAAHVTAASV